jgi:CheY-like chemotaxis protein
MATVLIVDDHLETCKPLVKLLTRAGIEADCVTSGPEALAFIRQHPTSLMLLDVMMPDMDGFGVLRAVRSDPKLGGVAVVMYSALSDTENQEKALRLGAQGFIIKPGTFETVLDLVKKYMGVTEVRDS